MLNQDPLHTQYQYETQRGSIVNTASMCGLAMLPGLSGYTGSKHAAVQLSAVDARDYASDRIRINCVCPGVTDTPMLHGVNLDQEFLDATKSQCPMNRLLEPREIAKAVVFLSGSTASGITGVSLPVDGGAMLFHAF
jgi:NAD(P)-dependent dehydrogenase (short-subunit alcohol dehydrogenase family)